MLSSAVYKDNIIGVVVDEVHLTYKWGESSKGEQAFRENFAKLGELRSITKEGTPVLALTASADIKSRDYISSLLRMDGARHILASPNKTNIRLGLKKVPSKDLDCLDWVVERLKDKGSTMQPILIYCQTMTKVGKVFAYLKAELQQHAWVDCDPDCRSETLLIGMFHSKTLPQHKERVLASLAGEGNCRVVVATTALGLGMNFPNVSHVVMYGVPGDLESIVQQVGRAGRNGQSSHGIIYNPGHNYKIDKEVKELLTLGKTTCIRKALYCHFEAEPCGVEPAHHCCTYCQSVCSCSPGTCTEPTPEYEQSPGKPTNPRSRHVTAEDKYLIVDMLNGYRDSLISPSAHLFNSPEACTGFSQQQVHSVLNHCQYI
ncbi:putative ATP-dependent DNA helicase Q1 [Engraulis encrasicolus]|uniref:putative ATP-dependent DNA helicase Q1 n=1 Tax=Engraulis encrasicolus TaxID=184585 RepID=UPI002FD6D71B